MDWASSTPRHLPHPGAVTIFPAVEVTDDELLARAREGEREALETLLLRHQDRVYRFGVQLCRDPQDARDVLQDTLLSMARSVKDFEGRSSLSTWLFTIARSFCIKKHRKSKFAPDREEPLDSPAGLRATDGNDPDASLAQKEITVALERAIRSLEPDQREVLLLRDAEGLTAQETAEVLGITIAAVKGRLHRARAQVRELLVPLLSPEPEAAASPGCPDIVEAFSKYIERDISPDLCAQLERHIAACATCKAKCDSLKQSLALCRATPGPEVPEDVLVSVRAAFRAALDARQVP